MLTAPSTWGCFHENQHQNGWCFRILDEPRVRFQVHDVNVTIIHPPKAQIVYLGLVPADQTYAAVIWPVDVPEGSCCGANDAHAHCVVKCCTDHCPIQHHLLLHDNCYPTREHIQLPKEEKPNFVPWSSLWWTPNKQVRNTFSTLPLKFGDIYFWPTGKFLLLPSTEHNRQLIKFLQSIKQEYLCWAWGRFYFLCINIPTCFFCFHEHFLGFTIPGILSLFIIYYFVSYWENKRDNFMFILFHYYSRSMCYINTVKFYLKYLFYT